MSRPRLILAAGIFLVLLAGWAWFLGGGQEPSDLTNWPGGRGPVVVYGDSLVAGTGAAAGEDFPSVMARELETRVLNAGVPGATSRDLVAWSSRALDEDPRLVVVAVGGNDLLAQMEPEATVENLRRTVRALQEGGALVALVGYRFGPGHWDLRGRARRIARETGAWYIDDPLEDLFDDRRYKSDRVHLNAEGYEILGERVAEAVRPLLEGS